MIRPPAARGGGAAAPLLAALLAAAPIAAPAAPAGDALDVGGAAVSVALEVRAAGAAPLPPLAWRSEPDGGAVGVAVAAALAAEVRVRPAPGGARRVEVRLRWRRAAGLERAALALAWTGDAPWAVGRDLSPAPLAGAVDIGRGTPLLAGAGHLILVGGPGVVAARLAPAAGGRVEASLLLDDAAERPFATYRTCVDRLPAVDGARGYAALERKRPWPEAPRAPGDEDRLAVTLYPVLAGPPARPLVVERWPAGARAAVVLADHADRTEPAALRAVLFGDSDARAEGARGAGLLGRGLAVTRSFFVRPGPGTLDDPETARLASWLVGLGSEVALHSITDGRDDRAAVRAGLAAAAPFRPGTWIDHEPYVNCEAISAEGAGAAGPYAIHDLLADGGIRWVWAAGDVGGFARVELVDLFAAAPPDRPSPVLYPLPSDPRLWVFQSSFFYAPPGALAAALSDAALDRLERGGGLFVGHTYLGAGPGATRQPEARRRLLVRAAGGGRLVIDPVLDEALARLAARVDRGTLASLTWSEAGDRLRALGEVEVAYRADGAAEVVNHGAAPLRDLTVSLPGRGLELWVDGIPVAGRDEPGGRTAFWFDLPAGGRRVIRASRLLAPVALLPLG